MYHKKSTPYVVEFHETADGRCQVREYLRRLKKKHRAEAGAAINQLEEEGPGLGRPMVGTLGGGIHELIVKVERDQHRILFGYRKRTIILLTNAFLKKSRKVPKGEIERAKKALRDWDRHGA